MSTLRERYDTAGWQALDRQHFLHPFTDHKSLHEHGTRIITRADGVYLWDSEGVRLLDAMAGLWCVNVGYGRHELADVAAAQMRELPYYNNFFKTANPPAIALSALLAELTPPQFSRVFYAGSGSEANDTIVRLVRRYRDVRGEPKRKTIISRWQGYHGSTVAGASLGGMSAMHEQGDLPIPGIVHIDQPYHLANALPNESEHDFGIRMARQLESKILDIGADKVAAFIGEPVQGAGGVIIPPASYWPEIQRIVDQYGILLISDEVICAFGRLGAWFAYEQMGYKPDLVTFAKGVTSGYMPLGGVLVGNRVAEVIVNQGGEFNHGYTYSGHPVACQVALANLEWMEKQRVVERVRDDIAPYLAERFTSLLSHPLVGEARTHGMMAGLVLMKNKATREMFPSELSVGMACRAHCFGNGLIMRAVGDRMIIAPPLVMTRQDIDTMMALILRCLDLTLKEAQHKGWC